MLTFSFNNYLMCVSFRVLVNLPNLRTHRYIPIGTSLPELSLPSQRSAPHYFGQKEGLYKLHFSASLSSSFSSEPSYTALGVW